MIQTCVDPKQIRYLGHHQLRLLHRSGRKTQAAKRIGEVDHDRDHSDQAIVFRC